MAPGMIGYGRAPRSLFSSWPGLSRPSTPCFAVQRTWMPGTRPGMTTEGDADLLFASAQHAHDVALLHDQELLVIELDLGARPFAEQHAVADLDVDRDQLAGFVTAARTDGDDFALGGLFLGAVGNDDATLGLRFGVDTLDHDTVMQRAEFGFSHDVSSWRLGFRSGSSRLALNAGRSTAQGRTPGTLSNHGTRVLIVIGE